LGDFLIVEINCNERWTRIMGIDEIEIKTDGGLGDVVKAEGDFECMGFGASPEIGWTRMYIGEIPAFNAGTYFELCVVWKKGRVEGIVSCYCELPIRGILLPDLKNDGRESAGKGKENEEKAKPIHFNMMIKAKRQASKQIQKKGFLSLRGFPKGSRGNLFIKVALLLAIWFFWIRKELNLLKFA
jgi:hypothetical protein